MPTKEEIDLVKYALDSICDVCDDYKKNILDVGQALNVIADICDSLDEALEKDTEYEY